MLSGSQRAVRPEDCLLGGGAMGELMRAMDWAATPLGPVSQWPAALRISVSTCLNSRFPILIWWGPEFIKLYNDAYRPMLGGKHPQSMGQRGRECWPEIWHIIGSMLQGVLERGEATWSENQFLPLERHGFAEECYFTFSYSPIRDEGGSIAGVYCAVYETTRQVVAERRLHTLRDLAGESPVEGTESDCWRRLAAQVGRNPKDVPWALFYRSAADGAFELAAATSGAPGELAARAAIGPSDLEALRQQPRVALLPIAAPGVQPYGYLVAGLSEQRPYDADYEGFLDLVAGHAARAIATSRAYEEERRRVEALADLNRAKTAFFSNVSHEFRTPLTLMLGPLAELVERGDLAAQVRERIALVQRNAMRLQRLVNALLEFSRVESGRIAAAYEPVDLAALTADVASTFRSAMERAGLEYVVDCEAAPEPAYVDREMWEKIVLNLLSNAFKYTLRGRVAVRLRSTDRHAVLEVEDSGVGIPTEELPKIFERFHRVKGVVARSAEGSGIGLALVRELVRIHGGEIELRSEAGKGSVFRVTVPLGAAHLPPEAIAVERAQAWHGDQGQAYVQEALRWLPQPEDARSAVYEEEAAQPAADRRFAATFGARIVLADDNADMRTYVRQLLSPTYHVEDVPDGEAALAAVRRAPPALVVADVMMPRMDGYALLAALRADRNLQRVPVLLLSARAGEEARIEGLDAGADDYVVKPFSARELLARIGALIERDVVRRLGEQRLRRAFRQAPGFICILEGPEHRYTFINDTAVRLFGKRDLVGKTLREAFPEFEAQGFCELLDHVYATGQRFVGKGMHVAIAASGDKPAHELDIDFVYEPLLDDTGRPTGIFIEGFDVTEQTRTRQALEAASRQKDVFLAMLAHELRNPLAPMVNASEMLSRLDLGDGQARLAIDMIRRQAAQLSRLVDDLLDVSRITAGRIELKRERMKLGDAIGEAVSSVDEQRRIKGHALAVEQGDEAIWVYADRARLVQVVVNLLTNAVKYTDAGGEIRVRAYRDGDCAAVRVSDNGIGIPADLLPHVFDLFVQNERALDRAEGGLGVGLSLVRQLVTMHGGTVMVESEPGRGATFEIRLPIVDAAVEEATAARQSKPARRRILVVDDNADAADAVLMLLRLDGHEVEAVHSAGAALDRLPALKPDIVLLDIGLPDVDGYEVARRVRADPRLAGVRLVALTGYGQADDRRRVEEAGFDAHLVKPVALEDLNDAIAG